MLKRLRKLGIAGLKKEFGRDLCAVLEKITELQSLCLRTINSDEIFEVQSMSSPPGHLQTLLLMGRFERFPHWFSKLQNVVKLGLWYSGSKDDSIKVLQSSSNLKWLGLFSVYNGGKMQFEGGFQKLEQLTLIEMNELETMTIDKGAMPRLIDLGIGPCPQLKEVPSGIRHLKHLNSLCFVGISKEFTQRLLRDEGEDYWIVKHVPILQYDATYDPNHQSSYVALVKRLCG